MRGFSPDKSGPGLRPAATIPHANPVDISAILIVSTTLQPYPYRSPMRIFWFAPAFSIALLVIYLSGANPKNFPNPGFLQADKVAHLGMYGLFTMSLVWGLFMYTHKKKLSMAGILTCTVIAAAYGTLMELMQYNFFPNRSFDYYDMIANTIGAILAAGFILFLKYKRFFFA